MVMKAVLLPWDMTWDKPTILDVLYMDCYLLHLLILTQFASRIGVIDITCGMHLDQLIGWQSKMCSYVEFSNWQKATFGDFVSIRSRYRGTMSIKDITLITFRYIIMVISILSWHGRLDNDWFVRSTQTVSWLDVEHVDIREVAFKIASRITLSDEFISRYIIVDIWSMLFLW